MTKPRMYNPAGMLMLAGMLGMGHGMNDEVDRAFKKVNAKQCGLPGCNNLSDKSYCCAEHCNQHKDMDRIARGLKPRSTK